MAMKSIFDQVEENMEGLVASQIDWTNCATSEQLQKAREGQLSLQVYQREIPAQWLGDLKGKKVLCPAC